MLGDYPTINEMSNKKSKVDSKKRVFTLRGFPRLSSRGFVTFTVVILSVIVGLAFWSTRPSPSVTPGGDFVAWVDARAIAMSLTECETIERCKTDSLIVTPGEKVRIGFRSGSPISLTTSISAGVHAAMDREGWYINTIKLQKEILVGVVGGDGNLWQFGLIPKDL